MDLPFLYLQFFLHPMWSEAYWASGSSRLWTECWSIITNEKVFILGLLVLPFLFLFTICTFGSPHTAAIITTFSFLNFYMHHSLDHVALVSSGLAWWQKWHLKTMNERTLYHIDILSALHTLELREVTIFLWSLLF